MWELKTLPESFGNLASLVEIDARHAQFNKLPESFGNLASLKILNLDQSEINELPQSFGNLSSLENLDIRSYRIVKLPDSMANLKALKYLHAHHVKIDKNKIAEIRDSIPDLEMWIHGCTIPMDSDIDDNAYRGDFFAINLMEADK
jgi:Leucine-rich repeat (LRR) protein